jgi:hypothetical protein
MVIQAAFELSCYDEIKTQLKKTGLVKEGEMSGIIPATSRHFQHNTWHV